jgi:hypothetical protein
VSHIPYWTPENVVNHLNVEPFSHARCVGPPLSVIARSPVLVCFGHTLHTGDEAISSLMRKRRDCHASPSTRTLRALAQGRLAMTALDIASTFPSVKNCDSIIRPSFPVKVVGNDQFGKGGE